MKNILYRGSEDTLELLKKEFPYYTFCQEIKDKNNIYLIIEESEDREILFKGNKEHIIEFLNNRENYMQTILQKDIAFLVSSEIARGINHYYFNIITSILLQIDLIRMETIKDENIRKGIDSIEQSVNNIIAAIEKLRELKLGNFAELNYNNNEFFQEINILLKDFLNTHKTKLELITNLKYSLNNSRFYTILILYLEIVMFLYHSSEEHKNKIKAYIHSNEKQIELLFEFLPEFEINILNNNQIDFNTLDNPFQKIYYISIHKHLKKLNGKLKANYNDKKGIELSICIKREDK